ncbi:MAG: hypothetical protein KGQ59_00155 [Bdellovibrionales bacterium]|nr:hypothetical protein [Bdellovibrionales bacterium]
MLGVLMLSHMTEPPTLALLAPVILYLWTKSGPWTLGSLVLGFVILPSDLTPSVIRELLGGQYFIKTAMMIYLFILLIRTAVAQKRLSLDASL